MTDSLYAIIREMPYYRRLAIVMLIADITPKELAYAIGLRPDSIYGYFNGSRMPNNKRRAEFAEIIARKMPMLKKLIMEE